MNGMIIIDKPAGITSFDVVSRLRRITGERRIGHAGTLDPMATGVLPVFLGTATKTISLLPCHDKRYTASFRLGVETDSGDRTGKVIHTSPVTAGIQEVQSAAAKLKGDILQTPPMVSAVRHNGRRLYELAREGVEVEREARPVTIYELYITGGNEAEGTYTMEVYCSKGTYIRTLITDIGQELGCGAMMTELRRTFAAGFSLKDAYTLEELTRRNETGTLSGCLKDAAFPFEECPAVSVTEKQAVRFRNGGALAFDRLGNPPKVGLCRVLREGICIGIAQADPEKQELKIKCLFGGSEQNGNHQC